MLIIIPVHSTGTIARSTPVVFELLERSAGVYHGVSTLCVANTIITYLLLCGKVSPSCPSACNKIGAGGFKLNPRSKSPAWNVIFRGWSGHDVSDRCTVTVFSDST
jgi:hypothetical protein